MARFAFKYVVNYYDKLVSQTEAQQIITVARTENWFEENDLIRGYDYIMIENAYPPNWGGLCLAASYIFKSEKDSLAFKLATGV
jgi:hypothetical protein